VSTAYWGTVPIKLTGAERALDRADGTGDELEAPGLAAAVATIGIVAAALFLAVLPAAIALRVLSLPVGLYEAGLGFLGVAVGGVKLIAMAWAVGGRLSAAHPAGPAIAAIPD
jgi:hypothetical protein